MPFTTANRVQETTSTAGTGTITLNGAIAGFRTFNTDIGVGNTTSYIIFDPTANVWEAGIGTVLTATTFGRTQVLSNSSGTTANISLAGNTTNVWCDYLAERSVTQFDVGTNANQIPLNQYLGRMAYQDYANAIAQNIQIDTNTTAVQPTLMLDFANAKTLDSRITFTRSTTAVAYDAKSSAVAEQNLFIYSQDFTNAAWSRSILAPTVTGNATIAPDGTTTASQIVYPAVSLANSYSIVFQNPTQTNGQAYTDSMYLKGSVGDEVIYLMWTTNGVTFVKTTCTLTTSWQRFVLPYTAGTSGNYVQIGVDLRDTTQTAKSAQTIYAWGAQLEQRSSATAYNATTTTALTNYIPTLQTFAINAPRIDYDPVTRTPLGLLIEQSSTNLITYSQTIDTTNWTAYNSGNGTTTIDTIAPDGTLSASTINDTSASGYYGVNKSPSISASTNYTFSCYVKQGTSTSGFAVWLIGSAGAIFQNTIAWTGGVPTATGWTATSVGNGWYRISYPFNTSTSTSLTLYLLGAIQLTSAIGSTIFWGAQLEALAFPTSYIKTDTVQVIRASDNASMTGTNFSSWYNQGQGTLYIEYNTANPNGTVGIIGSTVSTSVLYRNSSQLKTYNSATGGLSLAVSDSLAINAFGKAGVAYSIPNLTGILSANGTNSSSSGLFATLIDINMGYGFNSNYLNGHIKKLAYYPIALSSAELQEITS
jgi:hypothetical protein